MLIFALPATTSTLCKHAPVPRTSETAPKYLINLIENHRWYMHFKSTVEMMEELGEVVRADCCKKFNCYQHSYNCPFSSLILKQSLKTSPKCIESAFTTKTSYLMRGEHQMKIFT